MSDLPDLSLVRRVCARDPELTGHVVVDIRPVLSMFLAQGEEDALSLRWGAPLTPPFDQSLLVVSDAWVVLAGMVEVDDRPDGRWVVRLTSVAEMENRRLGHIGTTDVMLDGDGRYVGRFRSPPVSGEGWQAAHDVMAACGLFAFSLMNCRNVSLADEAERVSRQVRRQMARKGQDPPITYKVLKVRSSDAPVGGASAEGERLVAQHLARGHFKTYTADAPLFGNIVGTYWWSPQLRGNPSAGVVHKDYTIDPPKETA